ncbi:MAG: FecR family protein [Candidatus Gracilibacteria bacterium]|nr:FecR family protein [Candidatus Gracilibacteria bacterium]
MNKKAFSLIEMLISVSIIIILGIVATTTSNNLKNNSNNSKIIADLNTIENALVSYKTENQNIPLPGGNNNFFDNNGNYTHSMTSTGTFGVYGNFTENTLEKKFLDITPLDPRTNQYYSYGITKQDFQFEIAGVIGSDDDFIAKVTGNYTAEAGPYSLIREYNGPNFVYDKGNNLPYNPTDRKLIVTDHNGNIYKSGDTINNNTGLDLTLYFSDGSISSISNGTTIILTDIDFPKENNLVSKVNLFLQAGSIWTKATRLGNDSSFEINTSDLTASVRGTIFKVEKNPTDTEVIVKEGIVDIYRKNTPAGTPPINAIVLPGEMPKKSIIYRADTGTSSTINQPISTSENMIVENELSNFIEDRTNSIEVGKIDITEESGVIVDSEPKDCYLQDKLVKNKDSIDGYKEEYVNHPNTCTPPIQRACQDGKLDGDNDYKYATCYEKKPNECPPLSITGFSTSTTTPINSNTTISKTENIELGLSVVGNKVTEQTHKCTASISYNFISENTTINCDSGFSDDGNGGCKCNTGDFFEGNGQCYENPFGSEYKLVEVVDILPGGAFPYRLADIGSGFGIVFDTDGVSQNNDLKQYLYDYSSSKNIVYSINKRLKLSINGEGVSNVVKNSNLINSSTSKTLKLKFNGTDWEDLSGNIDVSAFATPILLNSQNLEIKNATNIRIFKKVNGPIPGEWYSGKGCDICPNGDYKNAAHTKKFCNFINGTNNICAEKDFFDRDKKNWSGTYNP